MRDWRRRARRLRMDPSPPTCSAALQNESRCRRRRLVVSLITFAAPLSSVALWTVPVRAASTTTTVPAVGSPDRIPADYSKLAPAVVARRALGAMNGDHSVDAQLTIANDTEPHVLKGNVDPGTGDARLTYLHIVADDPTSKAPNEVRIHENIGYGALGKEIRAEMLVDWYRYELSDTTLSPPDILIGSLVATSPTGASKVTAWRQTIDTTFGPKTRHFTGTASAKDALPLIGSGDTSTTKVTYDMWVDSAGELRRLQWKLQGSAKAGTSTLQLRADFRDRHRTLAVTAPLKNVVDLADLIGTTGTTSVAT